MAAPNTQAAEAAPERFGRYELVRAVAPSGDRGVVFEAWMDPDSPRQRRVALTILDPRRMRGPLREDLQQRWSLAANITHPALMPPLDFGNERDLMYVAVPWLDGFNLRTISNVKRAQGGRPASREVASLGATLAETLGEIHGMKGPSGASLVHGRLSPSRVMISRAGHVTLLGFPGTPSSITRLVPPPAELGLRSFLAPEQHRGELPTVATDVFALGLTLLTYATGVNPLSGQSDAEIAERALQPIDVAAAGCDPILAEILQQAVSLHPSDRPASVRWLAAKLEQAAKSLGGALTPSDWRVQLEDLGDVPGSMMPAEQEVVDELAAVLLPQFRSHETLLSMPSSETPAIDMRTETPTSEAAPAPTPSPPPTPAAKHFDMRPAIAALLLCLLAWSGVKLWGASVPTANDLPNVARVATVAPAPAKAPAPAAVTPAKVTPPPAAPQPAATAPAPTPAKPPTSSAATAPPPSTSQPAPAAPTAAGSGTITVRSTPPGVVYIRGQAIGTTPLVEHALPAGEHDVEVRLGGHETAVQHVTVVAGNATELNVQLGKAAPAPVAGTGTVTIRTSVPAVLYINGVPTGTTPLVDHAMPAGNHRIELRLGGHDPVLRDIAVKPSEHLDVDIQIGS